MTSLRTPLDPDADLRSGDLADRGAAQTDQNLALALRQARSAPVMLHTGSCLYCEEPVPAPLRFCEPDVLVPIEHSCIREWETLQRKRARRPEEIAITWVPTRFEVTFPESDDLSMGAE